MRLRLTIERNGLPPTAILWPVKDEVTVSQLLAKVDSIFPLASVEWDLEDYMLLVNGYECLHFQNLADVLKDEDQVT